MAQGGGEAAEDWLPGAAPEPRRWPGGPAEASHPCGGRGRIRRIPALHQRALAAGQVSTTRPTLRGKHMMTRFLLWLLWYLVFHQNPCVSGASFGPSCI